MHYLIGGFLILAGLVGLAYFALLRGAISDEFGTEGGWNAPNRYGR